MNEQTLKNIVEGALLAAGRSLTLDAMQELFLEDARPDKAQLRKVLEALQQDFADRSVEIKETGSGFRIQVRQDYSEWVSRLWEERPTRYSRALLETLALVAYRQPITRGEIEEVRGVSVSTSIMRTLQERDWVRVVGHRDVPGRPAMYGTTKTFLDYFGLKSLDELPTLAELRDIDSINVELDLRESGSDDDGNEGNRASGQQAGADVDSEDDGSLSVQVASADGAQDDEASEGTMNSGVSVPEVDVEPETGSEDSDVSQEENQTEADAEERDS